MLSCQVVSETGNEVVVALAGEFASEDWTNHLKRLLQDHYISDGVQRIRIDLSNVSVIDLEGVATLAVLWREAASRGKALTVEGADGQPREKLRQTSMLHLLTGGSEDREWGARGN